MAFKRFKRRSSRRSFKAFKRRSSGRRSSGIGGDVAVIGGALAYGAGREWLSQKLSPVTAQVAGVAGQYADEAVLGFAGYLMAKGKIPLINKVPMSREIGRAMLVVEAARVGSGVAGGMLSAPTSSVGNSILY